MVELGTTKGHGVIYIMTCISTGKSYIGQAINYTSCNVKWSGKGRVESHFREAEKNYREIHCRLLNDAIRQYGRDNFVWCNIKEVPEKDLNYWENYCIESYNTITPNGYNVVKNTKCFDQNPKMTQHMKNKEVSRCPKYIFPIINNTHVDGYYVKGYPNQHGGVYPKKLFNELTHNCRNLKAAKKYIKQLDVLNQDEIFDDTKHDVGNILSKTINAQTGLPKTIYRVRFNGKHIGYEILGFKTKDGKTVYKKFNNSKLPLKDKYVMILNFLENLMMENSK